MAITFDQFWATASTGGATFLATGAKTPSAGCSLCVVFVSTHTQPVTSITDNNNQTWLAASANNVDSAGNSLSIWYSISPPAVSTTITANFLGSTSGQINAWTFKGTATPYPLDQVAFFSSSSTGTALSVTLNQSTLFPNELIVAMGVEDVAAAGGSWTVGAGYTFNNSAPTTNNPTTCSEYQIVSSTSNYTATVTAPTSGHTWSMLMATFADTNVVNPTVLLGTACL